MKTSRSIKTTETKRKKVLNLPDKELPIRPLTYQELKETAKKRVSRISKEFREGFDFLKDYEKSVTFFGSSRLSESSVYYEKARALAKRIAEELGYSVMTGGGPGLMEAANRGAFEAGGPSLGLTIKLPQEQATNPYLTDNIDLYYFFVRKVCLSYSAEAYVFFPGGFGTLDEFFEIATLVQTHKIEKVPIILVGKEYWTELENFLKKEVMSRGAIDKFDLDIFTITDSEEEILNMIKKTPVRN